MAGPHDIPGRGFPLLRSKHVDRAWEIVERLQPDVDRFITAERVLRYVREISETPAPSTAASAVRGPVLRRLLSEDGAFDASLTMDEDFRRTGSTVLATGGSETAGLWFFAHLDTISYLVQPAGDDGLYPLVPFCYHLTENGVRPARAMRYELSTGRFLTVAEGELTSRDGVPFFAAEGGRNALRPGDRVVPVAPLVHSGDGTLSAHLDNAGGVAALAVAAPVLARAGIGAMIAFPDEEEGPRGSGNQMIGRGSARLVARCEPPGLAVVVDMQQAERPGGRGAGPGVLGSGAVFSEFSSLARGAVSPPPLYAALRELMGRLREKGVTVRESFNSYTSRSDDVSVMMTTPSILLLGFPGYDRHFDTGFPQAHLSDLVDLAKSLAYVAALGEVVREEFMSARAVHV